MAEIDKLLKMQEKELLKLEGREVAAFLKSYKASRLELRERLDAITTRGEGSRWTAQHTRIALAEAEDGIRVMQGQLGTVLSSQAIQRRDLALKHLTQTIGHFEPEFLGTSGGINIGAMRRLSESGELLLHKYSVANYSTDLMAKIQAELARGHSSRLSRSEVVKRIAGTSSVFTGMRHRAALIDRMENARAYDASFRAGLAEAAEELDDDDDDPDPLLKKAVEFIDKRSHPFSAAVDGRVARVGGDWEVPAADVRAAGAKMKKGIGGVLWRLDGGVYKGGAYPAHYNDRGRGIPWRASWGAFRGPIPAAVKVAKPKVVPAPPQPPAGPTPPPLVRPSGATPAPYRAGATTSAGHWSPSAPSTGRAGAGTIFDTSVASPIPAGTVFRSAKNIPAKIHNQVKGAAASIPTRVLRKMKERTGFQLWSANSYSKTDVFSTYDRRSMRAKLKTSRGMSDMSGAVVNTSSRTRHRAPVTFRQAALHESAHALDGAYIQRIRPGGPILKRDNHRDAFSYQPAWRDFMRKARKDGTAADFARRSSQAHHMAGDGAYWISNEQEFFAEVVRVAWHGQSGRDYLERTWPGILDSLDEMFVARMQ